MLSRWQHWVAFSALLLIGALLPAGIGLVAAMLLLPLLDRAWQPPQWGADRAVWALRAILLACCAVLLLVRPDQGSYFFSMLFWAALPEEWFFRAYLQGRSGSGWRAIVIASLAFALLHAVTRGPLVAVEVFWPSLAFGWLYQRSGDIVSVTLLHALSNLFFAIFLIDIVPQ